MQDMVTVKILGMTWVSTYRRVTLEGGIFFSGTGK